MGWLVIALVILCICVYIVVRMWFSLESLSHGPHEFYSAVEMQREGGIFLFNLALINNSSEEVWAEECEVLLSEFDGTPSIGFNATCKGWLKVREVVRPGQLLPVGLSQTVYEAAGRPQGEYSFVISGTLKYSIGHSSYQQSFCSRRVKMYGLDPVEVRRTARPERNAFNDLTMRPKPQFTVAGGNPNV